MGRDTSFYYSFLVLPPEKRRAIIAVWDFCRAVDDAVDDPPNGRDGSAEIAEWRVELARCYGDADPRTRQGRVLKPCIGRFGLPRDAFEDIIDGVAMDLRVERYATFGDLREYCLRVASAVGLVCVRIFGFDNRGSLDYARELGIALQLTNIVRDVPADLRRGRLYLPLEDLETHRCTEADLRGSEPTEPVRRLLAHQCARAREHYRLARQALPAEDARRLVAAEIMAEIYSALLDRIERAGYDVFSAVIRVPRPKRAVIAASTWLRTMVRTAGASRP